MTSFSWDRKGWWDILLCLGSISCPLYRVHQSSHTIQIPLQNGVHTIACTMDVIWLVGQEWWPLTRHSPYTIKSPGRPSASRQTGRLCRSTWPDGEGDQAGTEWKWARETLREGEMGHDAAPHVAPTRCCRISVFAAMNHCMTYIWAPQLGENLTDIITWQFPPTCSKLQSCNSLLSGRLLPNWSGLPTWCDNIIHCESQGQTVFQSIQSIAAPFLLHWKSSVIWFESSLEAEIEEKNNCF